MLCSTHRLIAEAVIVVVFISIFFGIIEEMVTINTYGMIGELDANNMTENSDISINENNNELLIKMEQQLST